jgi:hypothetical protein
MSPQNRIVVYGFSLSGHSHRVALFLSLLGLPYEWVEVDLKQGAQKTPEAYVVDAKGTRKVAEAYLNFLYTPEAQKLIAKNYYRPSKDADAKDLARFPKLKLASIDDPLFGGWAKAQPKHFDDGGIFDQIYKPAASN